MPRLRDLVAIDRVRWQHSWSGPDALDLGPERFVFDEAICEVILCFAPEPMFWNFWDRTITERTVDCGRNSTDDIADLLITSGQGDLQAEEESLTTRCCKDGIWPGQTIL